MNATVPNPPSFPERRGRPTPGEAAAELLTAGEALCRAARIIAELGSGGREPSRERAGAPADPVDRLSGKQLGAIRAASRRAGLSRDRLAALLDQLTGKEEPASLTRADASLVLDKLTEMTGYAR